MKTILYPKELKGNAYISIVNKSITKAGYEICDLDDIKHNYKLAKEIKIVNLNWFDSIGNCNRLKAIALLIRQILRVYYYKFCGMKIIYTLHNKQAHDTRYIKINKFLMHFLCKKSDRIAVLSSASKNVLREYLSDEEIEDKMRIMYHPSYKSSCSFEIKDIKELSYEKDYMHVLFLGYIRPYKNIEMIVTISKKFGNKKIKFVIAGKVISDEYKSIIEKKCEGLSNLIIIFKYISEDEIASYYNWADIMLIPLSIKSSLNSGSCMMAFTMGKTVIAPAIGTLQDFPENDLYMYKYENEDEHMTAIANKLEEAYEKWLNDPNSLKIMGDNLKNFTEKNFSEEMTYKRYKKLYGELI